MASNEIHTIKFNPNGEVATLLIDTSSFPSHPFDRWITYDSFRDRVWVRSGNTAFTVNYNTKTIDTSHMITLNQGTVTRGVGLAYDADSDSIWIVCNDGVSVCKYSASSGTLSQASSPLWGTRTCGRNACTDNTGYQITTLAVAGPFIYFGLQNGQIWKAHTTSLGTRTLVLERPDTSVDERFESAPVSAITFDAGQVVAGSCVVWYLRDDGSILAQYARTQSLSCDYNVPPACSTTWASVASLTPLDGHLSQVILYTRDANDGNSYISLMDILSVRQNEPPSAQFPDAVLYPNYVYGGHYAYVRATTSSGTGRIYTIGYIATDSGGESCTGTIQVCVPPAGGSTCSGYNTFWNSLSANP